MAVSRSQNHTFSKANCKSITLVAGHGVQGDAHFGTAVKHRSRVQADPAQPNLRQVHLIQRELLDDLNKQGFQVAPGTLGENVTTVGLDLLNLPRGAQLRIGADAVVEVTGLRNPCKQLDEYQQGLMNAVVERAESGEIIRKAGVMGIVVKGGQAKPGDQILVVLPNRPHARLERV